MLTLEQLRRRVRSAEDLHSITRAMKALAAVRIRESRRAVESLDEYRRTVELALQIALRNRPGTVRLGRDEEPGPDLGAIVFGSDLGLAGRFNIRISDFALDQMARELRDDDRPVLLAVGARVATQLEARGMVVFRRFDAPDSVEAVTPTVQELLVAIEGVRAEKGLERFDLFYNHYHSGTTYRPHHARLLPVSSQWLAGLEKRPWASPVMPTFRADWPRLFSSVVREHLFVELYGAGVRSQAAENASRLASMEAAERRVEERLDDLRGRFNQQRQQKITEELLDLVTGYVASVEDEEKDSGADSSPPT